MNQSSLVPTLHKLFVCFRKCGLDWRGMVFSALRTLIRAFDRINSRGDNQFKALERITDVLCRCTLVLAGYRLHNRGEWRKRK